MKNSQKLRKNSKMFLKQNSLNSTIKTTRSNDLTLINSKAQSLQN